MTTRHDVRTRRAALLANGARGGRSGLQYFVRTTIAVALAAAVYQPVSAQEATAGQSGLEVQEVVVTGSRIQRSPDLESSSPLVTVSSDTLTNISTVGVENALNQMPQFVPAQTQFVNNDNSPSATNVPGAATINLRGLGTNRTLVLLDGRRAQPANVALLVVDPNNYPGGSGTFLASENEIIQGNPDVKPEKAHTTTVGMVLRSPFSSPALHSMTATVDYYKIDMTDTIGVIDSVTVYQNCFNYNGVSNPNYDPSNSFCQLIGRQTTNGGRAYTTALYSNPGALDTKGLDFTFNWRSALDDMFGHNLAGALGLHVSGTWLLSYKQQTAPTAAVVELGGTGSYYSYRTLTGLSYDVGPASFELQWTHLPTIENSIAASQPTTTIQPTRQYSLFNLSAGWVLSDALGMRLGVDNLLDRQPPVVGAQPGVTDGAGSANASVYDVLGRRYYLSVKAKF